MKNAIFCAFDDNHWDHFLHCYNSIKVNYPEHPELLIFYKGSSEERISWLKDKKGIRLYLNETLSDNMKYKWYHKAVHSEMVYFKYMLWTDKFFEYDNILHLDVDTIILKSLEDLFNKEEFFIVKNNLQFKEIQILPTEKKYQGLIKEILLDHNIKNVKQSDMVNAGVFMIPKKYRNEHYLKSLLEITKDFGPLLVYADQSALSLWCLKHNIPVSEEYQYNFQTPIFNKFFKSRYSKKLFHIGSYFSRNVGILDNIRIIHFSGILKPGDPKFLSWKLMGGYSTLFKDTYKKYSEAFIKFQEDFCYE